MLDVPFLVFLLGGSSTAKSTMEVSCFPNFLWALVNGVLFSSVTILVVGLISGGVVTGVIPAKK